MSTLRRSSPHGAELKPLMLANPPLTLAIAESLTVGQLQARVGAVSGASRYFIGGITAYSLAQKVKHLGVDRMAAKRVNSVSAGVAEQMARGACTLFGADIGIATTGYAEPSSDDGVVYPFAWWAVARRGSRGKFTFRHGRIECPECSRVAVQEIVADAALAELVAWLQEFRAYPTLELLAPRGPGLPPRGLRVDLFCGGSLAHPQGYGTSVVESK